MHFELGTLLLVPAIVLAQAPTDKAEPWLPLSRTSPTHLSPLPTIPDVSSTARSDYDRVELLYQEAQIETWADVYLETRIFAPDGMLESEQRVWFLEDPLIFDWNDHYSYDSQDRISEIRREVRYWPSPDWQNALLATYSYDESEGLTSILIESWSGEGRWENDELITYTYYPDGRTHEALRQGWRFDWNDWQNYSLDTFAYDDAGRLETWLFQLDQDGTWENIELQSYEYDGGGRLDRWLRQVWQDTWQNFRSTRYTYFPAGDRDQILIQGWQGGQWTNLNLESFEYGEDGSLAEWLRQSWSSGDWRNNFLDTYTYTETGEHEQTLRLWWQGDEWLNYGLFTFTYYLNPSNTSEPAGVESALVVRNDPNPFESSTWIRFILPRQQTVRLSIYDATGRVVRHLIDGKMPAREHAVEWDGGVWGGGRAEAGVYFYRLETESATETGRATLLR